jgi:hypothetical protein
MNKRTLLVKEIENIPECLLDEVLAFIENKRQLPETLLLSENVLKKDWLSETEDRAWQDL